MERAQERNIHCGAVLVNPALSRSAWSDSREFRKVSLVREIVGYKPRKNTKKNAYLNRALESELVMTMLGPDMTI